MDTITIATSQVNGQLVITATVNDGSTVLPKPIFTYINLGTTTLGDYIGVCSLDELSRFQEFVGEAIPLFGNAFVRHHQAKIALPLSAPKEVIDRAVLNIRRNCATLKDQLMPRIGTSTVYTV